jgi:hypothetical protein
MAPRQQGEHDEADFHHPWQSPSTALKAGLKLPWFGGHFGPGECGELSKQQYKLM